MAYSFTQKKRIRKTFGKQPSVLEVPYLLATQLNSYRNFLQADVPLEERTEVGLHAAFSSVFPIRSYTGSAELQYVSYRLGTPAFDVRECQMRGMTYSAPLRVKVRLAIYDKESSSKVRTVKDIKEQEVYMGEVPLMTEMVPSLSMVPNVWLYHSCIVRLGFSLSMIKVKPILLANCCFLPA